MKVSTCVWMSPTDGIDLTHGEADIGIRCGPGNWKGLVADWMMAEEVVMICSPSLLPAEDNASTAWLAYQKLIQDDTPHPGANFPDMGKRAYEHRAG